MSHRPSPWSLTPLLALLALPLVAQSANVKHPEAPPELAVLEFMIGEWDLTTSFAQADGSRREEHARLEARWVLGGFGIGIEETHPYAEGNGGVFVSNVIYTVHPETRKIVGASHNTLGNRKLYELTVEEGGLAIVQKGELFGGREGFNRQWIHEISEQRFELRLDSCSNEGECNEGSYSYVATRRRPVEASP